MELGGSRSNISRQWYFTQLVRTASFGSWELGVGSLTRERRRTPASAGRFEATLHEIAVLLSFFGPLWAKLQGNRVVTDETFMRVALEQARDALRLGEVPVGAVIVLGGSIIGEGFNQPIGSHDATAHAEIVALRDAGRRNANYRLSGATLYVTIEPCQMCVGAMIHARIGRVVFGAREPKAGAIESAMRAHEHPSLNHRLMAIGGVLESECRVMIQEFFRDRRESEAESG